MFWRCGYSTNLNLNQGLITMNSLSWFLYFADVLASVRVGLEPVLVLSILGFVSIHGPILIADDPYVGPLKRWRYWLGVAAIGAGLLTVFLPRPVTMYAIAASEVGERLAQTDMVKEVASDSLKAIQQWVKSQAAPAKKGD